MILVSVSVGLVLAVLELLFAVLKYIIAVIRYKPKEQSDEQKPEYTEMY